MSIRTPAILAKPEQTPIHINIPTKCIAAGDGRDKDPGDFELSAAIVSEGKVDKKVDETGRVFPGVDQMREPFERIAVSAKALEEAEPGR